MATCVAVCMLVSPFSAGREGRTNHDHPDPSRRGAHAGSRGFPAKPGPLAVPCAVVVAERSPWTRGPDARAAVIVAGRGTARLLTFLGLYWMVGGLITLRFALAIRPRRGTRLAVVAGMAAVVGAVIVLLRDLLDGLVDEDLLVGLLGVSAVLTGLLRVLGGFAAEGSSAGGGPSAA